MVIVDVPSIWNTDDRRDSKRLRNLGHLEAKLDGHRVGVLDVSVFGARLNSQKEMPCGERVRLEIQGLNQEVYGWVLACDRKGDRHTVRIRFEEELELATLQKAA